MNDENNLNSMPNYYSGQYFTAHSFLTKNLENKCAYIGVRKKGGREWKKFKREIPPNKIGRKSADELGRRWQVAAIIKSLVVFSSFSETQSLLHKKTMGYLGSEGSDDVSSEIRGQWEYERELRSSRKYNERPILRAACEADFSSNRWRPECLKWDSFHSSD